ncbi:MAG: diphosphomevalonate decarboxylase [Myxococcota bacterium]
MKATARARANIALSKYWGKANVELNLPAVPSVSLTLDKLLTETTVHFRSDLDDDRISLDGTLVQGRPRERVVAVLNRIRERAKLDRAAEVWSKNHFPTAAGLASSASGFAALAAAATAAADLPFRAREVSAVARQASASAARSIYGGFAELPRGTDRSSDTLAAKPLHGEDHWDVCMVIALTVLGPKEVSSTEGMERSRRSSPFYDAWLDAAPKLNRRLKAGLRKRDLVAVGEAMEQSTTAFHATAFAAHPSILYFQPPTIAALRTVRALRNRGIGAYATMDAGPHVKVLCEASSARRVAGALRKAEGVQKVLITRPGSGVELR